MHTNLIPLNQIHIVATHLSEIHLNTARHLFIDVPGNNTKFFYSHFLITLLIVLTLITVNTFRHVPRKVEKNHVKFLVMPADN